MENELVITFRVEKSRFTNDGIANNAYRRESLLTATAVVGLLATGTATFRGELFSQLTRLNPNAFSSIPRRALVAGSVLLGFRSLARTVAYPIIRFFIYPRLSLKGEAHKSWNSRKGVRPEKIESIDAEGHTIHGHLIRSSTKDQERKLFIYCGGNGVIYDEAPLKEFNKIANKSAHDIVLFHPRGHGIALGQRSPHADRLALEALLQTVTGLGYPYESITIVGVSIGSGMASEIAANYPVGKTVLIAPFGTMVDTSARFAEAQFGWLGWLFAPLIKGIVSDYFRYDNVAAIRRAAEQSSNSSPLLVIRDSLGDKMMGGADPLSDAQRLTDAWHEGARTGGKGPVLRDYIKDAGINHDVVINDNQWLIKTLRGATPPSQTAPEPFCFAAKESRLEADRPDGRGRDRLLAKASMLILISTLLASWQRERLIQFAHFDPNALNCIPRNLCLLGSTLLAARSFGRLLTRGVIETFLFPNKGRSQPPHVSWSDNPSTVPLEVHDVKGRSVQGHLISPQSDNEQEVALRKVVIIPWAAKAYDQQPLDAFKDFATGSNHFVALYHAPGRGGTPGPRSPEADALALEAVVRCLQEMGYQPEQISVIGTALTNEAVSRVAEKYPLRQAFLIQPFGQLAEAREIVSDFGVLSRPFSFLIPGILNEFHTDYRNLTARGETRRLFLFDSALSDCLCHVDALEQEWNAHSQTRKAQVAKRVTVLHPSSSGNGVISGFEWSKNWLSGLGTDPEEKAPTVIRISASRFPVDPSLQKERRDLFTGRMAAVALAVGLWATYTGAGFQRLTRINPNGCWSLPRRTLLFAGLLGVLRWLNRSLWRGVLNQVLTPHCSGFGYDPSWEAGELTSLATRLELIDGSGRKVHAHLIRAQMGNNNDRKVVIKADPTYYAMELEDYLTEAKLNNKDILLFSPPGFGATKGSWSEHGNRLALEAAIQSLYSLGYQPANITVESGDTAVNAACHVAAKYSIGKLVLIDPKSSVVENLPRFFRESRFGRWLRPLWAGVLNDYFEYDALQALRQAAQEQRVVQMRLRYSREENIQELNKFAAAWNEGLEAAEKRTADSGD